MSQTTETTQAEQKNTQGDRSLPERVSFGIALTILASIVGLVIYLWVNKEGDRPPELSLERPEDIREANGQYYVPFELTNTGGGTAESVRVLAELRINGQVAESGEQEFDFLSGNESEEGAFVFSKNPRSGELTLRVTGYKLP
ncbi:MULTISPECIES: TIGR02588 family protein [unclassified Leptolyngbya]|uniref:TIGR02588 family protein n=1 Tax=unclassified Leptolyngbya TaxID=2650499 RepID=UPI00168379BE|nr:MULTISPECIES: TIGR02588 family protein [unclassified Leptolyngbya]MBD1912641.1 TIGR02588 family protein [Leptolyngbya sp. FACHB-8]MBD2156812.1 TIGR02588 family protein [Leptolyngbya sp. FACHB-16]